MTLSVIIPVYNTEKYLRRCLDSILAQIRLPEEIICVNDGSTDGSVEILKEYALRYSIVRVINQENKGRIVARRVGVENANSEYISFVDSDDFIEQDMFSCLMEPVAEDDVDLITSGFVRDYGDSEVIENEGITKGIYEGIDYNKVVLSNLISTQEFYRYNILGSVCTKIFKKNLLSDGFKRIDSKLTIGEDDAVCYTVLFSSDKVYVSGESKYHYCIRNDSTSAALDRNNEEQLGVLMEYLKPLFLSNEKRVPNIRDQYKMFEIFMRLFDNPKNVLKYDGEKVFPLGEIDLGESILLYGAGSLCKDIKTWMKSMGFKVVGIVDKNSEDDGIIKSTDILKIGFDKVVITAINATVISSIINDLRSSGVQNEKILRFEASIILAEG